MTRPVLLPSRCVPHVRRSVVLVAAIVLPLMTAGSQRGGRGSVAPPRGDSSAYGALSYRFIGPPGNRVIAVTGISGDANTYYIGAASGGISMGVGLLELADRVAWISSLGCHREKANPPCDGVAKGA